MLLKQQQIEASASGFAQKSNTEKLELLGLSCSVSLLLSYWPVDCTRAYFQDFGILIDHICFYISFGSQELSKNLSRVGGIDSGVEIHQDDNKSVQENQKAYRKRVFKMLFEISGR